MSQTSENSTNVHSLPEKEKEGARSCGENIKETAGQDLQLQDVKSSEVVKPDNTPSVQNQVQIER